MKLAKAALLFTLASVAAWAQVNVGEQKPEASLPFTMTTVTTFELPWRIAFLPDGRMLITEKIGPIWLVYAGRTEDPGEQYARRVLAGAERNVWRLPVAALTPPTSVSISPIPNRVTMAAAWCWPVPS